MKRDDTRNSLKKLVTGLAVISVLAILVPLIAMQFSQDVQWTASDFIVAVMLLFSIGAASVLASRYVHTRRSRFAVAVCGFIVIVWLWAELAVGVFTNWGS